MALETTKFGEEYTDDIITVKARANESSLY